MNIIERHESEVRGYSRAFPVMFKTAKGSHLVTEDGEKYLDFFAGAGVLNYGHNHPDLKSALLEYIEQDGVTHSLDMFTTAKQDLLARFNEVILKPRELDYKVQFPGPTGTNAVEAALKLARKVTGRERIVAFTNGFHGMTLGSLAVTGNASKRSSAGVPLGNVTAVPFDGYLGDDVDTLGYLEAMLEDAGSGIDKPAAVILETVQAEGGVNPSSFEWLKRLEKLLKRHDIMLIVDDIQVGCGRTGPFFSFEPAGIKPDIVCLSKSLSGYGLPFALVLLKPEHDIWDPGEHNGTFRGHNPAFITATAALDFWTSDDLTRGVESKAAHIVKRLEKVAADNPSLGATVRGRGMIQGLACEDKDAANAISAEAFRRGMIIETAGIDDEVLKLLPPLNISDADLNEGLDIIEASAKTVADAKSSGRGVA